MSKEFHHGMGSAVAERTILRYFLSPQERKNFNNDISINPNEKKEWYTKWNTAAANSGLKVNIDFNAPLFNRAPEIVYETWEDVSKRVARGNSLLCKTQQEQEQEYELLQKHISNATILMSGRHLQHGDETQNNRNQEVFTNCATAPTSFLLFYLLLNGCFIRGTLVKLSDGSYKPIEEVQAGDMVVSWDEENRKFVNQKVLKQCINPPKPMVRVTLENEESIVCTFDHKFLTTDNEWIEAQDLADCEVMHFCKDVYIKVINVEILLELYEEGYDLTVENTHTYVVSQSDVVVHNSGVGRSYDDDMCLVDWDNAPTLRCVIDETHKDFDYSANESVRDAKHKYGAGKEILWYKVEDSREGWAKAIEIYENAAFERIHSGKMLILDFSDVRPHGAPIKGMQNRPSSGPIPLMNALMKISSIKGANLPKWLQALYVDHYLAECVLVGGSRRCLPEDYLVKMNDGLYKQIKDITINDRILLHGKEYQVKEVFNNGQQDTIKIYTEDGKFHECTPEHRWLVYNHDSKEIEWKMAKELENGNFSFVEDKEENLETIKLLLENNYNHKLKKITKIEKGSLKAVYDIEIEKIHSFSAKNPDSGLESISHNSARMSTKYWKDRSVLEFIGIKRPIEYYNATLEDVIKYREEHAYLPFGFLWSSNNSVTVDKEFWKLISLKHGDEGYNTDLARHARKVFKLSTEYSYGDGTGEPGFINVDKLVQKNDGWDTILNGEYVGSKKFQVRDDTLIYLKRLAKAAIKKEYNHIVNPCITGDMILTVELNGKLQKIRIDSLIPVFDIFENIKVLSLNKDNEKKMCDVTSATITKKSATIMKITDEKTGKFIKCTPDHLIATKNRGWVEAQNLQEDDELII